MRVGGGAWLVLVMVLAGTSGCKTPDPLAGDVQCSSDSDCDDGLFCNGREGCGKDGRCESAALPCSAEQRCDEANRRCVAKDGTNLQPFVRGAIQETPAQQPVSLSLTGSDPDGDDLTFSIVAGPAHGTLGLIDNSANGSATVTYTPEPGFSGTDSFTFQASDGILMSAVATFTIKVRSAMARQYTLDVATYLGGVLQDSVRDIAVDATGNIYVAGGTQSPDIPVTGGTYSTTFHTGGQVGGGVILHDVYIAKFAPDGTLQWSTFLGGPNYDRAYAIEVDAQGFVYVAGRSGDGFPVTPGAVRTTFEGLSVGPPYGRQDAFFCKLTPDGANIVFCSYFGTGAMIRDMAVDRTGALYLATEHEPSAPNTMPASWFSQAFQRTPSGGTDNVVAKISPEGSSVVWATYVGGSGTETETASIRVDDTGSAYLLTFTNSPDMVTTPGAFQRQFAGKWDMYVAKLSPDGSQLLYGTYLGGSDTEFTETHGLAVDTQGKVYVAATTKSTDFPVTTGAFQSVYGGSGTRRGNYPGDGFVAKLSADGTQLLAATYLGGSDGEGIEGVALDAAGRVFVSGATFSSNFPVTLDAYQKTPGGGADLFGAVLSANLNQLLYATYLGGAGDDFGRTATADAQGSLYIAGHSQSNNFPTTHAFQPTRAGDVDGCLAKFRY